MAQAEAAHEVEDTAILGTDDIDTEYIVQDDRSGDVEYYLPYSGKEARHRYHFLRGACDAAVDTDEGTHICGRDAAYRRINDNGIEEFCRMHSPDQWDTITEESRNIDNCIIDLRASCEKCVSGAVDPDPDDPLIKPNSCGNRGSILVTAPKHDSDGIRSKAYCLKHAMDDWVRKVHLPTGFPDNPHLEGDAASPPEPVAYCIDGQTGRVFHTRDSWMQGMAGTYPNVHDAEDHLIVLNSNGHTIL